MWIRFGYLCVRFCFGCNINCLELNQFQDRFLCRQKSSIFSTRFTKTLEWIPKAASICPIKLNVVYKKQDWKGFEYIKDCPQKNLDDCLVLLQFEMGLNDQKMTWLEASNENKDYIKTISGFYLQLKKDSCCFILNFITYSLD